MWVLLMLFSRENARGDAFVWINVTSNPTAEWVARQITEAFPWTERELLGFVKVRFPRQARAKNHGNQSSSATASIFCTIRENRGLAFGGGATSPHPGK